jgi:hypothetical protein
MSCFSGVLYEGDEVVSGLRAIGARPPADTRIPVMRIPKMLIAELRRAELQRAELRSAELRRALMRAAFILTAIVSATLPGCADPAQPPHQSNARDSAGVRVVETVPAHWPPAEVWRVIDG